MILSRARRKGDIEKLPLNRYNKKRLKTCTNQRLFNCGISVYPFSFQLPDYRVFVRRKRRQEKS